MLHDIMSCSMLQISLKLTCGLVNPFFFFKSVLTDTIYYGKVPTAFLCVHVLQSL